VRDSARLAAEETFEQWRRPGRTPGPILGPVEPGEGTSHQRGLRPVEGLRLPATPPMVDPREPGEVGATPQDQIPGGYARPGSTQGLHRRRTRPPTVPGHSAIICRLISSWMAAPPPSSVADP
jgi:hypothetical protein